MDYGTAHHIMFHLLRHRGLHTAVLVHVVRARAGLTQRQLAVLSGVSRRTIQNLERGAAIPRNLTLFRLARALEVEPDELLEPHERRH